MKKLTQILGILMLSFLTVTVAQAQDASLDDILKKKIEFSCRTKKKLIGIPHKSHGQIWTNKMWEPKHLNLIYKTFKDKIVEYCIKNKTIKKINLKSIF